MARCQISASVDLHSEHNTTYEPNQSPIKNVYDLKHAFISPSEEIYPKTYFWTIYPHLENNRADERRYASSVLKRTRKTDVHFQGCQCVICCFSKRAQRSGPQGYPSPLARRKSRTNLNDFEGRSLTKEVNAFESFESTGGLFINRCGIAARNSNSMSGTCLHCTFHPFSSSFGLI